MDAFDQLHDELAELSIGTGEPPDRDQFMRSRLSPSLAQADPPGPSPQGETTPARARPTTPGHGPRVTTTTSTE